MKKLLSIALVLCMMVSPLGALGTQVSAAGGTTVFVGDVDVSVGGYWVGDGAGGITDVGADENNYTVRYEPDSKVLTLNGAEITKSHIWSDYYSAAIYASSTLSIELLGENSATGTESAHSYGIFQGGTSGTLTLGGSGALTATAGEATSGYSFGISAPALTISGGTVTAAGGTSHGNSIGIATYNDINISDGTVIATGGQATNTSVYATSVGISSNQKINISGGSVTASGGSADYKSAGIDGILGVSISGGAVVLATGGDAASAGGLSYGISNNMLVPVTTISASTVTAVSGAAATASAIKNGPTLGGDIGYEWRLSDSDAFDTADYEWQASHTYVEIRPALVPVTDIVMTNAATIAVHTSLSLFGVAMPFQATHQSILWSVEDAGTTGASIVGSSFRATSAGTATIKATITDGLGTGDYTKTFDIVVTAAGGSGSPNVSSDSEGSREVSIRDASGVVVSGELYGGIDVFVLTPSRTGAANEVVDSATYNQLRQTVESGYTPVAAYEVRADGYSGRLTLSFPVGEQYNGMAFVVKHKTGDGTVHTYTGTVTNGKAVVTVSSLSPFMIAIQGAGKNPSTGRGNFSPWLIPLALGGLCVAALPRKRNALKE